MANSKPGLVVRGFCGCNGTWIHPDIWQYLNLLIQFYSAHFIHFMSDCRYISCEVVLSVKLHSWRARALLRLCSEMSIVYSILHAVLHLQIICKNYHLTTCSALPNNSLPYTIQRSWNWTFMSWIYTKLYMKCWKNQHNLQKKPKLKYGITYVFTPTLLWNYIVSPCKLVLVQPAAIKCDIIRWMESSSRSITWSRFLLESPRVLLKSIPKQVASWRPSSYQNKSWTNFWKSTNQGLGLKHITKTSCTAVLSTSNRRLSTKCQ